MFNGIFLVFLINYCLDFWGLFARVWSSLVFCFTPEKAVSVELCVCFFAITREGTGRKLVPNVFFSLSSYKWCYLYTATWPRSAGINHSSRISCSSKLPGTCLALSSRMWNRNQCIQCKPVLVISSNRNWAFLEVPCVLSEGLLPPKRNR